MEPKNYKALWMGTLAAALTLFVTSYLYYNVIRDIPVETSGLMYKIIYTLIFSFALSYLCWKSKRTTKSHWVTGLVIGLLVSVLILVASRLVYFDSNETIICCQGTNCWIWALQIMMASMAAVAASDGRTGGGSDD
jgi:hypothetical protein